MGKGLLVLSLVAAALATGGSPSPAAPAADGWTAVASEGEVRTRSVVDENLPWLRVAVGDRLPARMTVATAGNGLLTLRRSAERMQLDARTELELPHVVGRAETAPVTQNRGSILYEVRRSREGRFKVVTPRLVATADDALFLLTVQDNHAALLVHAGRVEARNRDTGEVAALESGQTCVIRANRPDGLEVVPAAALPASETGAGRDARRLAREEARRMARALHRREAETTRTLDTVGRGSDAEFRRSGDRRENE